MVFKPKGTAAATSSGSSSEAYVEPESAIALPTVLMAIVFSEQPAVVADSRTRRAK